TIRTKVRPAAAANPSSSSPLNSGNSPRPAPRVHDRGVRPQAAAGRLPRFRWGCPMNDDAIRDLFAGLGPVQIKRMFGGKGIYHQGLIVAVEVDGEILLKASQHSATEFAGAGCTQWVYQGKKGRGPTAMPYWSIP